MEQIYQNIQDHIDKTGWSIMLVGGGETPPFAYTIGLRDKFRVELLMEAVPPKMMHVLLNNIARAAIEEDWSLSEPAVLDDFLADNMPLAIIRAHDLVRDEYTVQAGQFYGDEDYGVMQVVICDPHGRLPWDEGYQNAEFIHVHGELPDHPEHLRHLVCSATTQ